MFAMCLTRLDQLKPDMVLEEDLKDHIGQFLLPKGTCLTARQIRMLKMWGIIEANVEGEWIEVEAHEMTDTVDQDTIEMANKIMTERCKYNDSEHPVIKKLMHHGAVRIGLAIKAGQYRDHRGCCHSNPSVDRGPEDFSTEADLLDLVNDEIKLPTLSGVFLKINETIMNPQSSANDIASVISRDPGLAARLLKIVNSAFYGFPSEIDTLSRAVAIVGTKQLSILASCIKIIDVFDEISSEIIDMKTFWKHSIACGVIARLMAGYKSIQNTERLFVAGLLHDVGRLIMYTYMPALALGLFVKARNQESLLYTLESDVMHFNHAEIGGMLMRHWKLPLFLEGIVTYHHNPQYAPHKTECFIVHLADIIANAVAPGSSGEHFVPLMKPEAWDCLGLSHNVIDAIIKPADRQIEEITAFFCSNG